MNKGTNGAHSGRKKVLAFYLGSEPDLLFERK